MQMKVWVISGLLLSINLLKSDVFDDLSSMGKSLVTKVNDAGSKLNQGGKALQTATQNTARSLANLVATGIAQEKQIENTVKSIENKINIINKESDIINKIDLGFDLIVQITGLVNNLTIFVDKAGDSIKVVADNVIQPFDAGAARDARNVSVKMQSVVNTVSQLVRTLQGQLIPQLQKALNSITLAVKNLISDVNQIAGVIKK